MHRRTHYYLQHPKDGEGTVFTGVNLSTALGTLAHWSLVFGPRSIPSWRRRRGNPWFLVPCAFLGRRYPSQVRGQEYRLVRIRTTVPSSPPPSPLHVTARKQRGQHTSCIFTQEDFLVITLILFTTCRFLLHFSSSREFELL